jgi:hypothetical protein
VAVASTQTLATIFMGTLLNITFSTLLLTFFSCGNDGQPNEKTVQGSVSDTLTTEDENTGNKIDYDKTKILKSIYVVDRKGTEIKQQADKKSKTLGTYEFGAKLEVIEETEEWFGVRDRITREFLRNGSKIESTGWEKVYVLKSKTGSINEITLVPSDLNIISSLTTNKKTENFETDKELKDFLKIELIDKQLFDNKRSSSVNFLLADTTEIKKKKGIIELKCQAKVKKYIDKPDAEESMQVFNYVGQFEFLNKYLIGGSYYEGLDYKFIDKSSGEETQTFGEYPNISVDKKHIICIYTNLYEATADLELYAIDDKQIKHTMSASFKNWMPTVDPGEMFWNTDGYLYLTANHVNSFWKQDGNLNDKCQYIRIKIL